MLEFKILDSMHPDIRLNDQVAQHLAEWWTIVNCYAYTTKSDVVHCVAMQRDSNRIQGYGVNLELPTSGVPGGIVYE